MTLLGILFVVGVAFLGTMNFEASMIAAETTRSRGDDGIKNVLDDVGSVLRDGVMFNAAAPFAGGSALGGNTFAELPGWHNLSSPVEPYRLDRGTPRISDDLVLYPWTTDLRALKNRPFNGPSYGLSGPIQAVDFDGDPDTDWYSGIIRDLSGGGDFETIVDADGDGIVDSIQVDASLLGLSAAQMTELAARLNPPSNPNGRVFAGVRIIPHTGLVNLNQSHPTLVKEVLGLPYWPAVADAPDPNLGNFVHGPTKLQDFYAPSQVESMLRHRGMLLPRQLAPTRLLGDPTLNASTTPSAGADMQWQLFEPRNLGSQQYWSAFERIGRDPRRYWTYRTDEYWANNSDNPPVWAVRNEPSSTNIVDPTLGEYDRRHLTTTISHDDLLSRGGRVLTTVTASTPPITLSDDVLTKMREANLSKWDSNNRSLFPAVRPGVVAYPFEYADYPQTIINPSNVEGYPCLATDPNCKVNPRKGRLQLSLAWLDSVFSDNGVATDDAISRTVRDRLIYDAFLMLVNNASGPYWDDITCTNDADCPATEYCPPAGVDRVCRDKVTNQRHRTNLITRTAAALTANMLDYVDLECQGGARDGQSCRTNTDCGGTPCVDRAIPTRVALRSFDFAHPVCITRNGQELIAPITECTIGPGGPSPCPGGFDCVAPGKSVGREFDTNASQDRYSRPPETDDFDPIYIYGIEKQPYITEVATVAKEEVMPPMPPTIVGRAIEIFNPYGAAIATQNQYYLVEVDPAGAAPNTIPLTAILPPAGGTPQGPFTVFMGGSDIVQFGPIPGLNGNVQNLGGATLQFKNGWTIYLVRRVQYPGDAAPTDIVVDQFLVEGEHIGKDNADLVATGVICTTPSNCIFSAQRLVEDGNRWAATVPFNPESQGQTLGEWNVGLAGREAVHPVEIQIPNLGTFTQPFVSATPTTDPRHGSTSFPTTGSLLVLPRHANRAISELAPPTPRLPVTDLAFTARLNDHTDVTTTGGGLLGLFERERIDNGRMPVFDAAAPDGNMPPVYHAAHHDVSDPTVTDPSDANGLPWGQLVFDYFTVLPLNNAGPYLDPNRGVLPDLSDVDPASQPRVDLDGLRVHGRVNVNAAPATVLAGLPFVPLQKAPVELRARLRRDLGFVADTSATPLAPLPAEIIVADNVAAPIGPELAQAIVAYRELRPLPGSVAGENKTGNYNDGLPEVIPVVGQPPVRFGRGPAMNPANPPLVRRGTGLMSVGELANVRHFGAVQLVPPPPPGFPTSYYRVDGGLIDANPADNNEENFLDALATLYALSDWVTVRSQVFTVYGVLRGQDDTNIVDTTNALEQAKLRAQDTNSRAIRFQETIDRLPTVLGEPLPTRIGTRSVGRYTDVRND